MRARGTTSLLRPPWKGGEACCKLGCRNSERCCSARHHGTKKNASMLQLPRLGQHWKPWRSSQSRDRPTDTVHVCLSLYVCVYIYRHTRVLYPHVDPLHMQDSICSYSPEPRSDMSWKIVPVVSHVPYAATIRCHVSVTSNLTSQTKDRRAIRMDFKRRPVLEASEPWQLSRKSRQLFFHASWHAVKYSLFQASWLFKVTGESKAAHFQNPRR